ncbi:TPM domain-containing protein, partial [Chitinophagales bacterium]|nr:TPM domain-containing protein [Chitinophagales bacterium]
MKHFFFLPLFLLFAACGGIAAPMEQGEIASPGAASGAAAQGETAPSQTERANLPEAVGFVNDFADIYTAEEEASLEQLITQHEKATS